MDNKATFWYDIRKNYTEDGVINDLSHIFPNLNIEIYDFLYCSCCKLSFFVCYIENKKVIEFEDGTHNCIMCKSDINLCHKCCFWQLSIEL